MKTMTQQTEFRPKNYLDIIRNCSIEWIKENSKFYLLSHKDISSYALIWKTPKTNERGWDGVRMKREYHKDRGYYMAFEPIYVDVSWAVDGDAKKNYDITSSFEDAVNLANKHTT